MIGIVGSGLLAALAVFLVASGRERSGEGPVVGSLDKQAIRRDRAMRTSRTEAADDDGGGDGGGGSVATLVEEAEDEEPPPDPLLERVAVTDAELGVTRRSFFNRALLAIFGIFLLQFTIASLAFLWPKLRGGFGTPINAGKVADIRAVVVASDGSVKPLFIAAAQSWVVPFQGELPGSSFEETPSPITAGDAGGLSLMALWQRCVHLGCRVPECLSSQGFECPCHGSKYNFHGEYEAGPAPRNMDRFGVSVNDLDELIIDTGIVVQTARASNKTAKYPQGPSCL